MKGYLDNQLQFLVVSMSFFPLEVLGEVTSSGTVCDHGGKPTLEYLEFSVLG